MFVSSFRSTTFAASLCLAAIASSIPAAAMSVSPVTLDLVTTGKNTGQIAVTNDGATPLPVEIVVSRMEMDENGQTATKPAGDEFLVFPPQALLAPGAVQNFRVQWVGEPQISGSQSYILSINQVPVKMATRQSGVQVVFNFATVVNVAPPGGKSAISLVSAGIGKDENGKPRPTLTVRNPGNVYAKLTDATIKLSGGAWSETLRPGQLRQAMGMGLVQPGKTRRFLLPVDLPPGVGQVTASIDYKPAR